MLCGWLNLLVSYDSIWGCKDKPSKAKAPLLFLPQFFAHNTSECKEPKYLIFRRLLYMVNDQFLNWPLFRF